MQPLMWCSTACAAALERSSTGRMITWLRTPTRPFSRLYPWKVDLPRLMSTVISFDGASRPRYLPRRRFATPSPPLRLDVVDVGMLAHLDRRHDAPDVHTILDDG